MNKLFYYAPYIPIIGILIVIIGDVKGYRDKNIINGRPIHFTLSLLVQFLSMLLPLMWFVYPNL